MTGWLSCPLFVTWWLCCAAGGGELSAGHPAGTPERRDCAGHSQGRVTGHCLDQEHLLVRTRQGQPNSLWVRCPPWWLAQAVSQHNSPLSRSCQQAAAKLETVPDALSAPRSHWQT